MRRARPTPAPAPVTPASPALPLPWWTPTSIGRPSLRMDVDTVENLLAGALDGRYRIPDFQRGYVWADEDVLFLLDSLLRGYHVGTLTLWEQGPLPAAQLCMGGRRIPVPAVSRGALVIDGQQRLGALVQAFTSGRFSVHLRDGTFHTYEREQPGFAPLHLLPAIERGEVFFLDWANAHPVDGVPAREVGLLLGRMASTLLWTRMSTLSIPAEWSAEDVAEMFRRLNVGGVRAGVMEIEALVRGSRIAKGVVPSGDEP